MPFPGPKGIWIIITSLSIELFAAQEAATQIILQNEKYSLVQNCVFYRMNATLFRFMNLENTLMYTAYSTVIREFTR